ncbi:MAG: pyridoxamine 5'-phosphate oxidase [Deltaproteobacteria bacterium]|nr:pyridoxamine 5'-phosphate oxidase [Deltaproteobacteria bacterium]
MRDWPDAWLSEDPLPSDPFPIAQRWLDEGFAARAQKNPHAIALATVDEAGRPEVRMVLCKALEPETGSLVFYTNKRSPKGAALRTHAHAAAVFHFDPQDRQVRISGPVAEVSDAESDAYFATRPLDSRVGAWASAQSEPIASRAELETLYARVAGHFGVREGDTDAALPRPPHWGGYRIRAERVELWRSRPGRLHDRALWVREPAGGWRAQRLQP